MFKKEKNHAVDSAAITTLLGRDTIIEGTLTFKETIRVDGQIRGKLISAEGTLIVGENAVLDADIQVAVAIVRGRVNGRVEANQRVEIYAPAQVHGDIGAPAVVIDTGVVFNGNCRMQPELGNTGKSAKPDLKELKKVPESKPNEQKVA